MKRYQQYWLFLLICGLCPAFLFSQETLKGRVTEKSTGQPLIGVTVYFPEMKTGTVTDTSGNYVILHLSPVESMVQVSYIGYTTITRWVNPAVKSTENFIMEESVSEMHEVVITGTPGATEINRNPIPIITMNRISINQNLSTNIINALAKMPGVSEVTTGPNVSKPFIRGMGYNRILTLYDDVRLEDQQWGDEHGIEVDEYSISRAEVVKGPASLTYGSDALAGVVNLLPESAPAQGKIKGEVLAQYQTNNGLAGASFWAGGNRQSLSWTARVSHRQARDYQDPVDGPVYNTAFNETEVTASAEVSKKWGSSGLSFALYDDLQEIPDGSRDSLTRKFTKQITEADTFRPVVSNSELHSYKISTIHQHVQHYFIYSANRFIIGKSKLEFTPGYQLSIRREYSHPESPDTPGLYLLLNTGTYNIHLHLPEIKGFRISVGSNGMYQANKNQGTEFIIPDYRQTDAGLFLFLTKSVKKFDLAAGIRYDLRYFSNDDMYTHENPSTGFTEEVAPPDTAGADHVFLKFDHLYSGLSASLGATWNLNENYFIKANVARGYRAPNISEISANGVHPGTNMYQIGNPGFKPEFSLQEDLGLFFAYPDLSASAEVFCNSISNYIFNEKLLNSKGNDSIIVAGNKTYQFVQSQALLYGCEASLNIHPRIARWLHLDNSVSMIYAVNRGGDDVKITDSTRYLPDIPPLHLRSEIRVELQKKSRHFSGVYFNIGMDYFATQDRVLLEDGTETPTPGYILFDAGAGFNVTSRSGKTLCTIHLAGTNLFNIAYQSHLSRLKYFEPYPGNESGRNGIYGPGRNISFELIVPFEFSKTE
jgi:iron complex outermembrane recepter protein